ncbi:MAG: hypothetical protein ACE5M4_11930 [Anaerolineales bacterium]
MAKHRVKTEPKKGLAPFPFQLLEIRLYEVMVERCDPSDEETQQVPISIGLASLDDENESDDFRIHLAFDASLPIDDEPVCRIHLSIEGMFRPIVDVDTIKPDVVERFKENDSIVLFWPYLRQMLHDLTNRMRLGIPPLPVIDPRALVEETSEFKERIPETT